MYIRFCLNNWLLGCKYYSWNLFGNRFDSRSNSFTWEQFDLNGPSGLAFALNGYSSNFESSGSNSASSNREVTLDYYRKWVNDDEVEAWSNVNLRYDHNPPSTSVGTNEVQIELSGVVSGTQTKNNEVSINTDTPLHHLQNLAPIGSEPQPFTGQINLSARP